MIHDLSAIARNLSITTRQPSRRCRIRMAALLVGAAATAVSSLTTRATSSTNEGLVALRGATLRSPRLESGDLAFRHGRSIGSTVVAAVDPGAAFTHVGVVVVGLGKPFVVHVEPGDGTPESDLVRLERFEDFTSPAQASAWAVYRTIGDSTLQGRFAARRALGFWKRRLRFDARFDLSTHDSLYCTELAWRAYEDIGLNLAATRSESCADQRMRQKVLLPSELAKSASLHLVLQRTEEKQP